MTYETKLRLAVYTVVFLVTGAFFAWRVQRDAREQQHCVTTGGRIVLVHGQSLYSLWICDR